MRDNIQLRVVEPLKRLSEPRSSEVYNLGEDDRIHVHPEALDYTEQLTREKMDYEYIDKVGTERYCLETMWQSLSVPRQSNHICYITDPARFKSHYPEFKITKSLDDIFNEILVAWKGRLPA